MNGLWLWGCLSHLNWVPLFIMALDVHSHTDFCSFDADKIYVWKPLLKLPWQMPLNSLAQRQQPCYHLVPNVNQFISHFILDNGMCKYLKLFCKYITVNLNLQIKCFLFERKNQNKEHLIYLATQIFCK